MCFSYGDVSGVAAVMKTKKTKIFFIQKVGTPSFATSYLPACKLIHAQCDTINKSIEVYPFPTKNPFIYTV